ncbi:hypothetical protein DRP07_06200 [Archaeoglobales archaeon]|nr:MAG: hypothetical protein DRP07_06200 [Archaeoglobales archaeon]
MEMSSRVVIIKDEMKLEETLEGFPSPTLQKIVLKPNLINANPPPTTTPVDVVEILAKYYWKRGYEVIIAEGSGWCETVEAFEKLGYKKLEKYAKLVDLNVDGYEIRRNPNALFLKEFEFPLTLKDSYLVSVPILKEHSITGVSLSLKNMLGATLGVKGRVAKKGRFHRKLDESIVDINTYLRPSLAVIDGRIAGLGGELSSRPKKMGLMIISDDPVAADTVAASYLGLNSLSIGHIRLAAESGLGIADLNKIKIVVR